MLSSEIPTSTQDTVIIPQTHVTDHEFEISEDDFTKLSKQYLTGLAEYLEDLDSQGTIDSDDFDVDFAGDVLVVETGVRNMKYVINRQVGFRRECFSNARKYVDR